LKVTGSFIVKGEMENDFYGPIHFEDGSDLQTLDVRQSLHSDVVIDTRGKVKLKSDLQTGGDIRVQSGSFVARNKNISCGAFIGKGRQERKIDLEASVVEVEEWDFSGTENLSLPSSDYSLVLKDNFNQRNFKSSDELNYGSIATKSLKSSFTFSTVVSDATCYSSEDGSIEITVNGGTSPFDYEIFEGATTDIDSRIGFVEDKTSNTHTFTGLEQGTYMLRITDGDGDKQARTEDVGSPEPFKIDSVRVIKDLTCYDSKDAWFEVEVSGGTEPYSYTWEWKEEFGDPYILLGNDSVEKNIGRGFVLVSVDDAQGCGIASQEIYFETDGQKSEHIPDSISIDGLTVTDACEVADDGTVSITASGGTGDLDFYLVDESTGDPIPVSGYDEDGDFFGLAPGTYETWVIDENGCTKQGPDAVVGTIEAVSITAQPTDRTVCAGTGATFTVTAEGTNLGYQWQFYDGSSWQDLSDGGDISGATASDLTISNTDNTDEANYRVVVSGDCGPDQTSNEVSLTVNDATAITAQPTDQTVCAGSNVTLSLTAQGTSLSYQWQSDAGGSWQDLSDGGEISGATTSDLTLSTVELSDAADYRCVVTGDCGIETSDVATLTVDPATEITSQPSDKTVCEGEDVVFATEATGSGSLNYQWQSNRSGSWQDLINGGDISGADTKTLTLSEVDTTYQGDYRCIVTAGCGSDTTLEAGLTVNWFSINIGQPSPFSVDPSTTKITVSIEVEDHVWIHDLGYYLISPTGDRIRLGAPGTSCFVNRKASNLTFTTSATDTFNVCDGPASLTGTYEIAGSIAPLAGSDPANGAWKIRLEDTQNWTSDTYAGYIKNASLSFTDAHDVNGETVTVEYTGTDIDLPILERSSLASAPPAVTEYNMPTELTTLCHGECNAIAVASNNGGIPPYTYEWSDVPDFSNIIATGDTANLCAGTYYLRGTDALGCVDIDSVEVNEPEEIIIDSLDIISVTDLNGCYGDSIAEVRDSAYGGTGLLRYTLIRDPFGAVDTVGVNTSGDFTGLPGGEYLLEVTDDNNCLKDTLFTIDRPDSLEIINESFTPLSAQGATDGSIDVDAAGGTPPLSYVLHQILPADTVALDTTANGEFGGLGKGTYYVEVFDVNDCGRIQSSDFYISSLQIDFTVRPVTCALDSNGRVIAEVIGGIAPLRYEWTSWGGDTLRITEGMQVKDTLSPVAGGRYVLNVTDDTGNNKRDTATVFEPDPLEIVNIIPDTLSSASASDASITINATGGNDSIIFEITNLNVTTYLERDTIESVNDSASAQFSNLEAGLYEITVYDEKGCGYDVDSTHVIHYELTVSKEDILCNGQNNGLAVASISGGTNPFTYDWGIATHTIDYRVDSLTNRSDGWYYVTVTDANGFALTDSVEIIAPPPLTATAVTEQANCPYSHIAVGGDDIGSIQLSTSGGVPFGDPDNRYHYYWEEIGDTIPGKDSLVGIKGGDYQVRIIDQNGCTLEKSINVPQVTGNEISVGYGGVVDSICHGSSVAFYVETSQNADSLMWEGMGTSYVLADDLDTLKQVQTSDEVYTLRARNDACILVDSFSVALYPTIGLSIDEMDEVPDGKIRLKENITTKQLAANVSNSSVEATYLWQPGDFFNPVDQLETELSVEKMRQQELAQQMIQVIGTTAHCIETDSAMVQLIPNVEPSNAFSPNGDGTNDRWHIRYAEQYEQIEVVVFNRWGVEVFRTKPYRNGEGWNGRTSKGKELPSGTYYYVIDTHESGIMPLSGTVTIVR